MQTETIWNDIYAKGPQTSSGKPGLALSQFAGPLRPGTALELGCARGDDAVYPSAPSKTTCHSPPP